MEICTSSASSAQHQKTADMDPSFSGAKSLPEQLLDLELQQSALLQHLTFGPPISVVYHPLTYAFETHSEYVRRFCKSKKTVLFLGMNPGPYGMVQSGVPFGECRIVTEWMRITGVVRKPPIEHEKRPIFGLSCKRSEVSGSRFWSFIRAQCRRDVPDDFFEACYVHNYCPAAFIDFKGKNIALPVMKKCDLTGLETVCNDFLVKTVDLLEPRVVVCVGKYVLEKCSRVLAGRDVRVESIMHPSPANPLANGGAWEKIVKEQLERMNVLQYMAGSV